MKNIFSITFLLFSLSSCGLISAFKIRDALLNEKIVQYNFKTQIPFEFEKGIMLLKLKIANETYNFVFDTGANTVIDDDLAKKINFKKIGIQRSIDSGKQKRKLKIIELDTIQIKNIQLTHIVAAVSDLEHLKAICNCDIDGILGANVMNKAIWDIDFEKQVIMLTDVKDTLKNDSQTPINFYSVGKGTPQIRFSSNHQYWGELDLDTGSNGGIDFPMSYLKYIDSTHELKTTYSESQGLFGRVRDSVVTTILKEVRLGDKFEVKNVPISFHSKLSKPLIGTKFLKDYHLKIDWKYQEIVLVNKIY